MTKSSPRECQLARSDALYRVKGFSEGADDEEVFADDVKMPIFYDDESVILWAKEWLDAS